MIPTVRAPRTGLLLTTTLWVFVVILTCVFAIGCTNSAKICQEIDWYEIGRRDGLKGLVKNEPRAVQPVCTDGDQSLTEALYNNGFDAGVAQFCNPTHGFELGRTEQTLTGHCPPLLRDDFMKSYERGKMLTALEKQSVHITRRIQSLSRDLQSATTDIVRRGLIEGEKLELIQQQEKLKKEIAKLQ